MGRHTSLRKVAVFVALMLACVTSASAKRSDPKPGSGRGVVKLVADNFTQALTEQDVVLVEFYAPWCGHCRRLAPTYAAAARRVANAKTPLTTAFAAIDATANEDIAEQYSISGFPTMLVFHKSHPDSPQRYFGDNSEQELVDFMLNHARQTHWKPPPDATIDLDADSFEAAVAEAEPMLVAFVAPWCSHCKRLKPILKRAARLSRERLPTPVPIALVDCDANGELCTEHGVEAYPTLKLFRHGRSFEYEGPKDSEVEVVGYLSEQQGAASGLVSSARQLRELMVRHYDAPLIIGFFELPFELRVVPGTQSDPATAEEILRYAFFESALADRKHYPFAHASYDIAAEVGIDLSDAPQAAVVMVRELPLRTKYEPWYHVFTGEDVPFGDAEAAAATAVKDLRAFYADYRVGLVGNMHGKNGIWFKDVRPLLAVYHDIDYSDVGVKKQVSDPHTLAYTSSQYWRHKVLEVADEFRGQLAFTMVNAADYVKHIRELGLDVVEGEVRVGIWGPDGAKYRMVDEADPAYTEFSVDGLRDFVQAYLDAKLPPYVLSQPVPKPNPRARLQTLVGKNFKEALAGALEDGKDMFIDFYAPWELEPKLERIATLLRKEEKLGVAKIDASNNDVPPSFDVTAYPSLFLVPAMEGAEPMKYEGELEVKPLMRWLELNTSSKLAFFSPEAKKARAERRKRKGKGRAKSGQGKTGQAAKPRKGKRGKLSTAARDDSGTSTRDEL